MLCIYIQVTGISQNGVDTMQEQAIWLTPVQNYMYEHYKSSIVTGRRV